MYEVFNELIKIFFKILYFEFMFRILALDTETKELGDTSFFSCSQSMSTFKDKLSPPPLPSLLSVSYSYPYLLPLYTVSLEEQQR